MDAIDALLLSAWALALMGIWLWVLLDAVKAAGQGWLIASAFALLVNVLAAGAWLRGFRLVDKLPETLALASGASALMVILFWLRGQSWGANLSSPQKTGVPSRYSSLQSGLRIKSSGVKFTPRGVFVATLGAVLGVTGLALMYIGFAPPRTGGSSLLNFRLDHPAFIVALVCILMGSAMAAATASPRKG